MQPSTVCRARLARAVRFGEAADLVAWIASDPAPKPEHRAELAALLLDGVADGVA